MQYKILNEQPWQILTDAMTIGPSSTGYQLQVAADGRNYTTLFTVGAGITRQITNLSSGSYFRMKGNVGEVTVNWVRSCGGGSGSGGNAGELEPVSEFPVGVPEGTVVALSSGDTVGVFQFDGSDWVAVGVDDLSDYYTKDETNQAISAATTPIEERIDDVERVTASALTELHNDILDLSGATPTNSPVIPAITSLAEYEAISGDVKTGDLIQVYDVDINDDGDGEYGLFEAEVGQNSIEWIRRDNRDSVLYSDMDYPWMEQEGIVPIDLGNDVFFISTTPEEEYYGIGFDADGVPVITHIVPEYDEQTGDITGMTREDKDILGELDGVVADVDEVVADVNEAFSAITETQQVAAAGLNSLQGQINTLSGNTYTKAEVDAEITGATQNFVTSGDVATQISTATANMVESTSVSTIWRGTQAEYDAIVTPDASTLYIIVNN